MKMKLATGIQSFEKIRTKNLFYIDKTEFIKKWWESEDINELVNFIPNLAENWYEMELTNYGTIEDINEELENWGYVIVALTHSKYIGDDIYLVLETEKGFQKYESGWHPYE